MATSNRMLTYISCGLHVFMCVYLSLASLFVKKTFSYKHIVSKMLQCCVAYSIQKSFIPKQSRWCLDFSNPTLPWWTRSGVGSCSVQLGPNTWKIQRSCRSTLLAHFFLCRLVHPTQFPSMNFVDQALMWVNLCETCCSISYLMLFDITDECVDYRRI